MAVAVGVGVVTVRSSWFNSLLCQRPTRSACLPLTKKVTAALQGIDEGVS